MSEDIAAELLFCEFRSNLTRTTSHDWHVQPYCQRSAAFPHWAAAFGLGRHITLRLWPSSSKPFKHTTRFPVLSTRVPQLPIGEHRALNTLKPMEQNAQHAAPAGLRHENSAHEGTRAFDLVKDLVLEVFGFPLTLPSSLAQHPAPRAGQLYLKRYNLDARISQTIQNRSRFQTTATLLADFIFISDKRGGCNPCLKISRRIFPEISHSRINTGDFNARKTSENIVAGRTLPAPPHNFHTLFTIRARRGAVRLMRHWRPFRSSASANQPRRSFSAGTLVRYGFMSRIGVPSSMSTP